MTKINILVILFILLLLLSNIEVKSIRLTWRRLFKKLGWMGYFQIPFILFVLIEKILVISSTKPPVPE
jgi:hypothetical protein